MAWVQSNVSDTKITTLLDAVAARIPSRLELASKLMAHHSKASIHETKVANVMKGMRGMPCMLWEISETKDSGVTYHGKTFRELDRILPKWKSSEQFSPEAMLWFLYTATVPTRAQLEHFAEDLVLRAELPDDVKQFCDSLTPELPPMTQMIMSLAVLSRHSKFSAALAEGAPKTELWKYAFEDALDGTARTPFLAARIHSNIYNREWQECYSWPTLDPSRDLADNFTRQLGREGDNDFIELIRLYWSLHMDHGVNVSAHAMRLCSSAWTDVYLALSAGFCTMTGPLHAAAITHTVEYNLAMADALGPNPSKESIEAYVRHSLDQKLVVPGYGHAVLRCIDPRLEFIKRYIAQRDGLFLGKQNRMPLLGLVSRATTLIPEILRMHAPKMENHAPNVDAASGSVLHAFGLEMEFLVPVMGCSRSMGFLAQFVWDRVLGLPIERPLSVTMDEMLARL